MLDAVGCGIEGQHRAAAAWAPRDVPLVISEGCGLNCEWNKRWVESGLFSDAFVPPCANDSSSAIGTAMDAAVHLGEPARVEWDVYSGAPFRIGEPDERKWSKLILPGRVAADVLTQDRLRQVFGIDAELGHDSIGNPTIAHRRPGASLPV